jgi:hypothetical protein
MLLSLRSLPSQEVFYKVEGCPGVNPSISKRNIALQFARANHKHRDTSNGIPFESHKPRTRLYHVSHMGGGKLR